MIDTDQSFFLQRFLLSVSLLVMLFVAGCALVPPVQEMSNARQSLAAAKSAGAEVHDSKRFLEAKALLDKASKKIDEGEYADARHLAIKAHTLAIKSRQVAISKN